MKEFVKNLAKEVKNNPALYSQLLSLLKSQNQSTQIMLLGVVEEVDKELANRLKQDLFPREMEKAKKQPTPMFVYVAFSVSLTLIALFVIYKLKKK